MRKYSRKQIAKAYLKLRQEKSSQYALEALAATLFSSSRSRDAELVVREIGRVSAEAGHVPAHIISARELSHELKQSIENLIKDTSHAQTVSASYEVNPDILGGFIVSTPTGEIDASIQGTLKQLQTN